MSPSRAGRRNRRELAVITVTAVVAVTAMSWSAAAGLGDVRQVAGFGALIMTGEILRIVLPGNREVSLIGWASALGYALARTGDGWPRSMFVVIAVTAIATAAGSMPHVATGRRCQWEAMARRVLAVAVTAAVYPPMRLALDHAWWAAPTAMACSLAASFLADLAAAAFVRADLPGRFRRAASDQLRATRGIFAAAGATAMMIAILLPGAGPAGVLAAIALLAGTQIACQKLAAARSSTLQIVRSLGRALEIGGYVTDGHTQRVSRIAVAIGRELAMPEPDLLDLEYAALMHDIGQFRLPGPLPGGATSLASPEDQRFIAQAGAQMITRAHAPGRIAQIISAQHQPCPSPTSGGQVPPVPGPPLASRIIKVANLYDDLTSENTEGRADGIIDLMEADTGSGYDPAVIQALRRTLGSRADP